MWRILPPWMVVDAPKGTAILAYRFSRCHSGQRLKIGRNRSGTRRSWRTLRAGVNGHRAAWVPKIGIV